MKKKNNEMHSLKKIYFSLFLELNRCETQYKQKQGEKKSCLG